MCNFGSSLLCSSYSSQGTVATVCRWCGQINNYYIADFVSMPCAKYCRSRPAFVETRAEQRRWTWHFLDDSAYIMLCCLLYSTCCHFSSISPAHYCITSLFRPLVSNVFSIVLLPFSALAVLFTSPMFCIHTDSAVYSSVGLHSAVCTGWANQSISQSIFKVA